MLNWRLHEASLISRTRTITMGARATETARELEDTSLKYQIGGHTEKMWQRLKGILRCLVKQLEKGDVNVVDLKKNIEYAASVLEAVYIDETSALLEDTLIGYYGDECSIRTFIE
ncbi:calcium/calmodulin-dependent 3',5'-cyclic nucleotide phosphodiesterase 1A-like [Mauremys mutica]|uniref:calcium/calmodulin-dependent 3',5'-cyclic nucleotide phosphodiesterase 1A-like n=1 Tax=Mauremys mutica TaxID=74926 RepID=UPI001D134867|nr:calcium/calmodulin-dependent 3',5'-cyclic nucleotide phosphodiesterase 1A-like [Mauremys mutica]